MNLWGGKLLPHPSGSSEGTKRGGAGERLAAGRDSFAVALDLLSRAASVCVLTGAGISTDSGISDFRGPQGLWTRDPSAAKLSTLSHYLGSRQARVETWRLRAQSTAAPAQPNSGHRALVDLEHRGRLQLLVTQNVDGLHLVAGTSVDKLVELHGSLREYRCLSCDTVGPMAEVLERVRAGDDDPSCQVCGGILKSAAISFGQRLPAEAIERAQAAAHSCEVLLTVGTRLQVFPAAELPAVALAGGAKLVIVNQEATRYDRLAAAVIRAPISQVLPAVLAT